MQVAGRRAVTGRWRIATPPSSHSAGFLEGVLADEGEECCGSRIALLSDASSLVPGFVSM